MDLQVWFAELRGLVCELGDIFGTSEDDREDRIPNCQSRKKSVLFLKLVRGTMIVVPEYL